MLRHLATLALITLPALPFAPLQASDGAVLINQAAAMAGDVTPGDPPGFPVELHEPGLYRLVGNLDTRDQPEPWNLTVIAVRSGGVTIDLNGFEIRGPTTCNIDTSVCAPTATEILFGNGILVAPLDAGEEISFSGTRILNGRIRGMPTAAVLCAVSCSITDLHISNSGIQGMIAGSGSIVERVIAEYNAGAGIGINGTARNLTARFNFEFGIFASGPTILENSQASDNLDVGIFANPGTSLINNLSTRNGGNGFRCFGCSMFNNHASRNEGFGAVLGGSAGDFGNIAASLGGNNFTANGDGSISVSGNHVMATGANACTVGSTTVDCDFTP